MLTGSRRRGRFCRSCLGDEAIDTVSAFPFKLLIEAFAVIIEAVELDVKKHSD